MSTRPAVMNATASDHQSHEKETASNMITTRQRPILLILLCVLLVTLRIVAASSPATKLFHFQSRRNHAHPSRKRRHATIGSLIRLKKPTTERVSGWFSSSFQSEFNHDDVGMTNPCLHVDLRNQRDTTNDNVVQVSSSSFETNTDIWWPACPCVEGWKRLRLSRRVGWGASCYHAVRDAALEWEFTDPTRQQGIVQVHPPHSHAQLEYQRRDSYGTGYDVVHNMAYSDGDLYAPSGESALKIWSGPGGRRLATYTRVFRSKWLPRIYNVNPVNVVYDLVDQRGPSTTYSSTAYATCKGHWLRGEERVTVAHRDDGHVDVEIVSYSQPGDSLLGRIIWPFVGPLQGRFFQNQLESLQHVAQEQHDEQGQTAMGTTILSGNDSNRRGPVIRQW